MKPTRIPSFLLLCLIIAFNGYSQQSEEFKHYKNLYPDANAVRLQNNTVITLKLNSDKIDITQEYFEEDLYLDDGANHNSKQGLQFSSFFELEDVEASSFVFENGKYKEIEVTDFKTKDEIDNSFYDDTKSLNFIYPNLKKGAKSTLKYVENVKNPRFLSPFYFGNFFPIANNKVTIVSDKNIKLSFKEFNTDKINIQFKKEEKRNNIIYTWEAKDIEEFKPEPNTPTYKKIFPHIVPIITSYEVNKTNINLANDVSDLYSWYYSLIKDINKEAPTADLKKIVDELTENKPNDFEKVKAIYYWVQKNIKYIAFEYALGGFIPREANDVFQKKYGDCKDNASILFKMLEIAGIKGHLTWIGTRSIPYTYEDLPTPIVDNHMILSYTDKDNTYFLDATGRYISIDYPTPFIQGKEALIASGDSSFVIKTVPVVPSYKNAIIDSTTVHLEGETLVGTSKSEVSGYEKMDCFDALENKTTDEDIKEFYKGLFQKGTNKFLIDSYSEFNKFDYDKNLIVEYLFNIDGYAKKLGDEIFINLNLNKDLVDYKVEADRKNDMEYDYKSLYSYTTTLKIPEGYTVGFVPDNIALQNDFMSVYIKYQVNDDNSITYSHSINQDFLSLNLEQQKELNDLIKKVERAYKDVIVLKKS